MSGSETESLAIQMHRRTKAAIDRAQEEAQALELHRSKMSDENKALVTAQFTNHWLKAIGEAADKQQYEVELEHAFARVRGDSEEDHKWRCEDMRKQTVQFLKDHGFKVDMVPTGMAQQQFRIKVSWGHVTPSSA